MRNIFDQYSQPENKLTHSLVSCLYEEKYLLNSFLKNFCPDFFNLKSLIQIDEQSLPGNSIQKNYEYKDVGLPDAIFYNDEKCLIIESKVSSKLTKDQLIRHETTIQRRGFDEIKGIAIVVDLMPNIQLNSWKQLTWNQIYSWAYFESSKSNWAKKLLDYFKVLENNMVEDEYLKEGSITEFTGVHFDISNPYSYREGKRQLRLLINKIKTNQNLSSELNIDLEKKGRGGIKKVGNLWDYLTFKTSNENKNFTDEPHLTIGMSDTFIESDLTIPYRIKGKTKNNFYNLSWDDFRNIIYKIALNYDKIFGQSNSFKPQIVMAQRRYPSQSSPAIHDARLEFDIRTAFDDISTKLKPTQKKQEEWLRLVYDLNNNKKSNLQFQVGARFFFNNDSLVNNKNADKILCDSFLACKPLIDHLFDLKVK